MSRSKEAGSQASIEWAVHSAAYSLRRLVREPRDYHELVADCFPQAVGVRLQPYPQPNSWDAVRERNLNAAVRLFDEVSMFRLRLGEVVIAPSNPSFKEKLADQIYLDVPDDHKYRGEIRQWVGQMQDTDVAIQRVLTHLQELFRLGGQPVLHTWPELLLALPGLREIWPRGWKEYGDPQVEKMAKSEERAEVNQILALLAMVSPDMPLAKFWITED